MDSEYREDLGKIAGTIAALSMDAVEKARSGHPGMPMGCAFLGAYLYGRLLRHNPKNPHWMGRDRLVLSAGHGSMWLYSCLHLAGFDLSLDDIKRFRQLHSKTPGHPEYGHTPGVEATTGPLGQGVANAVGIALGLKMLQAKLDRPDFSLFDARVYCVAGDGCMMEGISSEAASFAGHLGLDNLVLLYDYNHVCLDGPTSECFSEDTKARFGSYGWDVAEIDGYDFEQMEKVLRRGSGKKPLLVLVHTVIGKGAPKKEGTSKAHGSPLGPEELALAKEAWGLSKEPFYVPQSVYAFFERKREKDQKMEEEWNDLLRRYGARYPDLLQEILAMQEQKVGDDLEGQLRAIAMPEKIAGRAASGLVLQKLAKLFPWLVGGSADLSGSDATMLQGYPIVHPHDFAGRNIKYGVREFAMGGIASGLFLTGMFRPFCGTFFTFSDYMRNAMRLSSLSHYKVIYQFTHDSIFLGEDGPTHQSIEQLAALRAMPNLWVFRPADAHEVVGAWIGALSHKGPCALVLSRQNLPTLMETNVSYEKGVKRGAYILRGEEKNWDCLLLATGSEVALALDVASSLERMGKKVRVVSMPCWELFEEQPKEYREKILGDGIGLRVAIEAASELGWHKYVGMDGLTICMESFGLSAPEIDLAQEFGFTRDAILERIVQRLSSSPRSCGGK